MLLDLLKNKELSDNHDFDKSIFKIKLNSQKFKLFYEVKKIPKGFYPQVGLTARQGILILYKYPDSSTWFNLDSYSRNNPVKVNMKMYNSDKHLSDDGEYQLMIIAPILSELKTLKIAVPKGCTVEMDKTLSERKMVVAGGINSFGIGCTTVGTKFSNILSRKLDLSVMDLTYNNRKGYLEDIYNFYENNPLRSNADVGILELDHVFQNDEIVYKYLKKVINHMRKQCKQLICWYCVPESRLYKRAVIFDNIEEELEEADNITLLDLSFLYDEKHEDMCTSSVNFINDAGNVLIYKKLEETIREVTKWNI